MNFDMKKVSAVDFAKAIADETRQKIMEACCCQWCSVNELAETVGVSQPTVSHHLAILRQVELVDARPEGKQTFYTLNQNRMVACCGQLMLVFAPEAEATAVVKKALS
jgi:DNA-binding transcriptional ArsR family regulator